jgi:predicted nucleic acid-binding protein
MERVRFRATLVRKNIRHLLDYPRDPDDERYIDLAASVKADYLVTRDTDLLDLMTGHTVLCKQFRQRTHPLRIVDPIHFSGSYPNCALTRSEQLNSSCVAHFRTEHAQNILASEIQR